MMKVKLGELEGILKGFGAIMIQKMPVKTAYRLSKAVRALSTENRTFEELRLKVCQQYCNRDDKGKPIIENGRYVGLEGNAEFNEDFNELSSTVIDVDFEPLALEFLEKEGIVLTGAEVMALGEFIKE